MSVVDNVKALGSGVMDVVAGAVNPLAGLGLFSTLLDQVTGGKDAGQGSAAGAVSGDGTSAAVRSVLIGQQAVVPMGMEDKGHISQAEKEAKEMLSDMTEGGLNGYWKWVMKQLREQVLEEMGLSEDQVAAMDPASRDAVEKAIAEEVQKRLAEMMKGEGAKTAGDGKDGKKDEAAPVAGLTA